MRPIVKICLAEGAVKPTYATSHSSGMDVFPLEERVLGPGQRMLVRTGIRLDIPPGFEVQVRPRSGLALKHGVTVLNSPGTIDADYRGECNVILMNTGLQPFPVRRDQAIAQFVFSPVTHADLTVVEYEEDLSKTERGEGGFGHTDAKRS